MTIFFVYLSCYFFIIELKISHQLTGAVDFVPSEGSIKKQWANAGSESQKNVSILLVGRCV